MVRKVGKYEVGKTIGEGAYSKVKYAIDTESGARVAIKIMDQAVLKEQKMLDAVRREIQVMKSISHPNVVNLLDVMVSKTNIYLVLELVSGGELFAKLANEDHFDEATAKAYFWQLIEGLEHCHSRGIAHRDLKPENLLLDEHNMLKITDFGLAALFAEEGKKVMLRTAVGTAQHAQYAAPEVSGDIPYDGEKADIWSCGIILYAFLTGRLPFQDTNPDAILKKAKNGWYPIPDDFPPLARDLLSHVIVVDPAKRFNIAQIKLHPWLADAKSLIAPGKATGKPKAADQVSSSDDDDPIVHVEEETTGPKTISPLGGVAISNAFELISLAGAVDLSRLLNPTPGKIRKHYTRFVTKAADPKVVLERLVAALEKNKAAGFKINEHAAKIKVRARTPLGLVGFQIQVLVLTHGAHGLQIVDFKRSTGDSLEFNALYRELRKELQDLIPQRLTPQPERPHHRTQSKEEKNSPPLLQRRATDTKLSRSTDDSKSPKKEKKEKKEKEDEGLTPRKSPQRRKDLSSSFSKLPFISGLLDGDSEKDKEKKEEEKEKKSTERRPSLKHSSTGTDLRASGKH